MYLESVFFIIILLALAKPRFLGFLKSFTSGYLSRTRSAEPSLDALSATKTLWLRQGGFFLMESRHLPKKSIPL